MMAEVRDIDAFRQCCLKDAAALLGLDVATVYGECNCLQRTLPAKNSKDLHFRFMVQRSGLMLLTVKSERKRVNA
jgi:hypothetical protein